MVHIRRLWTVFAQQRLFDFGRINGGYILKAFYLRPAQIVLE